MLSKLKTALTRLLELAHRLLDQAIHCMAYKAVGRPYKVIYAKRPYRKLTTDCPDSGFMWKEQTWLSLDKRLAKVSKDIDELQRELRQYG